jgi:hypothetical protein
MPLRFQQPSRSDRWRACELFVAVLSCRNGWLIYVATVHHRDARWIEPQAQYLRRNMAEPYRVYASCEGIDSAWHEHFDVVVPSLKGHAGKLNLLAGEIADVADPDDLIVFLDGDAFPVADPMPLVRSLLSENALVAIRRDENMGPQPHPSFCVTTLGTWRALIGDWSMGFDWSESIPWQGLSGAPTDVGANLLRALERSGTRWAPLLRSNKVSLHPVLFGVYGDIVYHHGVGFRKGLTQVDVISAPQKGKSTKGVYRIGNLTIRRRDARKRYLRAVERRNQRLGNEIFQSLLRNPDFWRKV